MRNTKQQLIKEIAALDLALKLIRQETQNLRRSVVTIKRSLNAPLTADEANWFSALPPEEAARIVETALLIAKAVKPVQTTSTTPTNGVLLSINTADKKPAKRTRQRSNAPARNARWTPADDKNLLRMVKAKETHEHMAMVFGRSVGSVQQRIKILKGK
jgi:hypothetical protein